MAPTSTCKANDVYSEENDSVISFLVLDRWLYSAFWRHECGPSGFRPIDHRWVGHTLESMCEGAGKGADRSLLVSE